MIIQSVRPRDYLLATLLICMLTLPYQLLAQQLADSPPPAAPQTQAKSADGSGDVQGQPAPDPQIPKNDRILWTLPNYLTVENASSLPPMTTGQKFKLVAEGTFDPIELVFIAAQSGIYQANNSDPTLGQGFRGYAKRYGLTLADDSVENFMVGAVFASALRQDPRYFQLGKGSFLHRVEYAGLRVVIIRSDSGKNQFNFSEILGSGTAAGISNIYHPGPWTMGSTLPIWGEQIGWDTVGYEMKEFWPDVKRFLLRGHHKM
ncbi:MAG TPA: hypothetical protein VKO18_18965 [Terriglobia bacterium]|nr:hypothetical protein [Terriglobia bacterium]